MTRTVFQYLCCSCGCGIMKKKINLLPLQHTVTYRYALLTCTFLQVEGNMMHRKKTSYAWEWKQTLVLSSCLSSAQQETDEHTTHECVRFVPSPRPASEYSSPLGRPLSCVVDENTPVMTPVNGAEASGPPGEQRNQERRVRSQRHRNYMSRTHLHSPPDLPEGYGEIRRHTPSITWSPVWISLCK